ncbi:MAG: protein kinase [Gemmatimonadetes bacterium]|nr:protein kinase [Gemmatimonadota bacterium]
MSEPMRPESSDRSRRERAEQLHTEALAQPAALRSRFLDDACGNDERLRAELGSLLEHAAAAEAFFDRLAEVVIPPEPSPGPTVGHYQILGCIGAGGMGAVYRARDTRLGRDVALKFLPVHASAALDVEQRLLLEARAAAALEHTNVCTVHEIGETEDGRPFIAMACYEGETLKERLLRGPLPVAEATDIATQVARGLTAAHAHGVVHRDVKPGNIMLTPDGTVKLLDFGLAKVADISLTRPGSTPGTVAYMSPEQIDGDVATPQSDLWSLGVVLYEMLTGVLPFRGGNDRALIHAILHDHAVPVRERRPETPQWLERVSARLLQKDPLRRCGSAAALAAEMTAASSGVTPEGHRRRRAPLALAGLLILVLGVGALLSNARVALPGAAPGPGSTLSPTDAAPLGGHRSIAVLPFTNLSRDPEQDYFSDGLTEELIGALSRVGALRVAARTSAFAFKGQTRDIREIGEALNVGTVLEGSVRSIGERIRVEARLINVADGLHLWSDTYERELTDGFTIQSDLALSIALALRGELTPAERLRLVRRPTSSGEAFALYLKGRHFWNQRTPIGFDRAIEYFQRAIAIDSQFAAAHAGLAGVYSLQGLSGAVDQPTARQRVRAAALRAVELDDDLAEAHAVLGIYLHAYEWDADGAERAFLRSIDLDPGNTAARHYYGNLLAALGRLEEAVLQKSRAVELDPLAPALSETLAFTLIRAGRLDEALQHVSNAIELDSTYWRARAVLGNYYESTDRFDDAIDAYERANALAGSRVHRTRADIARVLARTGRVAEARALVAELQAHAEATGTWEPAVATALMALGESKGAFVWLEHALEKRHPHVPFVAGDPRFARFVDDPRFVDLMQRAGVPR